MKNVKIYNLIHFPATMENFKVCVLLIHVVMNRSSIGHTISYNINLQVRVHQT